MANTPGQRKLFSFGLFDADPSLGRLLKEGQLVSLQDQPFRMLILLLERAGEVVTREEARRQLWPANTFVEFDNGLNVAMKKIRDALGDNAENPRFVETLPRRGYRFIAPVSVQIAPTPSNGSLATEVSDAPTPAPVLERVPSAPAKDIKRRYWITALVLLASGGIFIVLRGIPHVRTPAPPQQAATIVEAAPRRSVAIMEFQNSSGQREYGWLATAIPEMLSTELAAGEKLRLIPVEDVARVQRELHLGRTGSLARDAAMQAGKNLQADLFILGSFATTGPLSSRRLRVDLRLQDALNGQIIAALAETGTERHMFELISRAGAHVRERLGLPGISQNEEAAVRASVPANREAARLYAEGQARMRVLDTPGARDLLENAVRAEPAFPLSHMALASCWRLLGYDQKAKAEAKLAFERSADLPRADRLLIEGRYHEMSGEVDQAIAAYRARFALSPDSLEDGLLLAQAQAWAGKRNESRATVDALRRLPEPLSQDPRLDIQQAYAEPDLHKHLELVRRAQAKAKLQHAALLEAKTEMMECNALQTMGQPEDAVNACETALRAFSEAGDALNRAQTVRFLGDIRYKQGRLAEALELHGQALSMDRQSGNDRGSAVSLNQIAIDYEAQADLKKAEQLYRQSYALFVKVGNRRNAVVLASNVGGTLLSQVKLAEAENWFQKSLQLAQELGAQDIEDSAHDGFARLALIRGDLSAARRELEAMLIPRRVNPYRVPLVINLRMLSEVLAEQGDLAGAFENARESLQIAEKIGARAEAAETRLLLGRLHLEQAQASQAQGLLRDALAVFHDEKMRDDEFAGLLVLSHCLLMQGRVQDAQAAVRQARAIGAQSQDPRNRLHLLIAEARVSMAASESRRSALKLNSDLLQGIRTARNLGLAPLEYEARLTLGEAEMHTDAAIASKHLTALRDDAHAHGFELIARKATTLARVQ